MSSEANSRGETMSEGPKPAPDPIVSVILVCRWEARQIRTVLESILAQEEPDGGFEVILADGMSDDGTREILEEIAMSDSRVKVIDNPGRIAATGLNAAIRRARGQIIIRMDAHTHYAPDYLRQCVSVLRSTGADNVGGPWVAQADGYVGEAIAAAFQSPFAAGGARGHVPHYEGPVDTVYLGCWKREVFDRFGCFDEGLVRDQDDEHNLRIVRGGGRIWQSPRIRSWYHSRTSLKGLFRQVLAVRLLEGAGDSKASNAGFAATLGARRIPADPPAALPGLRLLSAGGLAPSRRFCGRLVFILAPDPRVAGARIHYRYLRPRVGPGLFAFSRADEMETSPRFARRVLLLPFRLWLRIPERHSRLCDPPEKCLGLLCPANPGGWPRQVMSWKSTPAWLSWSNTGFVLPAPTATWRPAWPLRSVTVADQNRTARS